MLECLFLTLNFQTLEAYKTCPIHFGRLMITAMDSVFNACCLCLVWLRSGADTTHGLLVRRRVRKRSGKKKSERTTDTVRVVLKDVTSDAESG